MGHGLQCAEKLVAVLTPETAFADIFFAVGYIDADLLESIDEVAQQRRAEDGAKPIGGASEPTEKRSSAPMAESVAARKSRKNLKTCDNMLWRLRLGRVPAPFTCSTCEWNLERDEGIQCARCDKIVCEWCQYREKSWNGEMWAVQFFLLCTACGEQHGGTHLPSPAPLEPTPPPADGRCAYDMETEEHDVYDGVKKCDICNRWVCNKHARDDGAFECRQCPVKQARTGQTQPMVPYDITRGEKRMWPNTILSKVMSGGKDMSGGKGKHKGVGKGKGVGSYEEAKHQLNEMRTAMQRAAEETTETQMAKSAHSHPAQVYIPGGKTVFRSNKAKTFVERVIEHASERRAQRK